MLQQHFLDLARVDVGAARDDQVLRAVLDGEESFGVEAADIAGMQPAAAHGARRCFRVAPVARHHAVRARDDLAGLARKKLLLFFIEYLYFDSRASEAAGRELL